MFALLTNCGGRKWSPRCLRPFIEWIRIGTKRKVGVRFLLEARAQPRPLEVLGSRLERNRSQLNGGPEIEFRAGLIPDIGNAAHEIAGLRVERLGLKPNQEWLYGCVVDVAR